MRNGFKPFIKKTKGKSMRTFSPCPHSSCALSRGDRASFHSHHPQSGFVLFSSWTHTGLCRFGPDTTGTTFGTVAPFPCMCSSCTEIQSQLDTVLPIALSSLRAIRINDFQAQSTSLWASGDCEGEGPTSRPLLPALPGPIGGRACVLSQGVFKCRG